MTSTQLRPYNSILAHSTTTSEASIRHTTQRVLVAHGVILLWLIVLTAYLPQVLRKGDLTYVLSLISLVTSGWLLISWRISSRSLFDPYGIFLVAAIAFNLGQALLEALSLNRDTMLGTWFSSNTINLTITFAVLGIASFHLGGLYASFRRVRQKMSRRTSVPPRPGTLRLVGLILIVAAIIPTMLVLQEAIAVVNSSGYFSLYQRQVSTGIDSWSRVLSTFLIPGALFLVAGSEKRTWAIILSGSLVGLYSLIQVVIIGQRAWGIMPLIAFIWLFHRIVHRLRLPLLIVAAFILVGLVFPLVRTVRNTPANQRLSVRHMAYELSAIENPIVVTLSEMGTSAITIAYTTELVPKESGFEYGLSYIFALSTAFPNLFWDIHPAIAHGLPGSWLVQRIAPEMAAEGGGFGYSFIAEAYLNFGWYGGLTALAVLGFLLARLALSAEAGHNVLSAAFTATFLSFVLLYARGEAAIIARGLLWYSALPYLGVLVLEARSNRREIASEHNSSSQRSHIQEIPGFK